MTDQQPESRAGAGPRVKVQPLPDGGAQITAWHPPGIEGARRLGELVLLPDEWEALQEQIRAPERERIRELSQTYNAMYRQACLREDCPSATHYVHFADLIGEAA